RAHHHGVVDLALLHPAARRGLLHAHLDEVADGRIAPLRAAHHLDALDRARAGIVGDVQYGLHLNHCGSPLSNLRRRAADGQFWTPAVRGPGFYTAFDFSTRRVTFQDLVLESGRHSAISTRSPSLNSLVSVWAWYFFERVMILPIIGSLTRRSTRTVTVFCILSLTTRPTSLRWFFTTSVCSVISRPFLSSRCAPARCCAWSSSAGWCWKAAGWRAACAGRTAPAAGPRAPFAAPPRSFP